MPEESQENPQLVPSHVAADAYIGTGQAVHSAPQLATELFDTQTPPQS